MFPIGEQGRVSDRRVDGWEEVVYAVEVVYDGGLAPWGDNPLGGTVLDVMFGDVVADRLPVPTEAVAEIGRHSPDGRALLLCWCDAARRRRSRALGVEASAWRAERLRQSGTTSEAACRWMGCST